MNMPVKYAPRTVRPSAHPMENANTHRDKPGAHHHAHACCAASCHLSIFRVPVTPDVFADLTQVVSPSALNLTVRDTGTRQIPDFRRPFKTGMEYAIRLSTQTPGNEPDEAQPVTCI
jgi:hypothetical protein